MTESTLTAKGQTTVPAQVRERVRAKPGTKLVWSVMPDGTIIVRAKTQSILNQRCVKDQLTLFVPVTVALELYRRTPAGFADCLHIALAAHAGEPPLWTFDKRAAKVLDASLLTRTSFTP